MVGLMTQLGTYSRQNLKSYELTFFGTRIRAHKTCHTSGGLLTKTLKWLMSSRDCSHDISLCMRKLVLSCRAMKTAAIMTAPKVQNAI